MYKSLEELVDAHKKGLLPTGAILELDNDCYRMHAGSEDSECLFRGGEPTFLLEDALTLLGIPWSWV